MLAARLLTCILGGVALLACMTVIQDFAVRTEGLDRSGDALLWYNLARVGLAALLGYAVYACGRAVLRVLDLGGRDRHVEVPELTATLIIGLSVVSLLMFGIGAAGLYYRATAIALVLGLFVLEPVRRRSGSFKEWLALDCSSRMAPVAAAAAMAGGLAVLLLANRGLFIGEPDNDVWEHYLHYYDAVVRNHSVRPNDLWVHFYVSKAAGGFFLAAILGDIFSVQLVSWLCVLLMALIAHVLVRTATDSRLGGLAAAGLVLASWNAIGGEAGSALKHHTVVAALMISLFWCGYESVVRGTRCDSRITMFAGAAAAFYLGLYITVAAGIAAAGLAALSVYFALFPGLRPRAWTPALLGGIALLGSAAALAINYAWTGLALDAPVGIFWPLADRERFARLWSPLVVEYWFLGPASVESAKMAMSNLLVLDWAWWVRLLRAPYISLVWMAAALFAAGAAAWRFAGKGKPKESPEARDAAKAIGAIVAFVSGVLLVSQLFRNSESVYRLYAFLLPLVICALVVVWLAAARLSGEDARPVVQWMLVLTAAYCAFSMLRQVPAERWHAVWSYISGASSTREGLKQTERSFPGRVSVDLIAEFRMKFPDTHRILFLTYDPAPAYFLPGPPIVSEPAYAFGGRYDELLFSGDPGRTEELLRRENIGYVAINLRNRLFLGLPYAKLFSGDELRSRFGLAFQRDGIFILGWKSDGVTAPLPEAFLKAVDAKKSGVVPAEADELWGKEVADSIRGTIVSRDQNSGYLKWLYKEMEANYRPSSN